MTYVFLSSKSCFFIAYVLCRSVKNHIHSQIRCFGTNGECVGISGFSNCLFSYILVLSKVSLFQDLNLYEILVTLIIWIFNP